MAKLEYRSDKQVKTHMARYSAPEHKTMEHEKMESPKFEKAEHRLGGKKMKSGVKGMSGGRKSL
jgi:hypothetical protein